MKNKPKRNVWDILTLDLKMPVANDCVPWLVLYLLGAGLVYALHSTGLGILLFANAAVTLVIGLVTRGMGKDDKPAVLLGLLLGPVGALAGMVATPPKKG